MQAPFLPLKAEPERTDMGGDSFLGLANPRLHFDKLADLYVQS